MNKPTLISINQELLDLTYQRESILRACEGEITKENETVLNELELRLAALLKQNKDKVSSYCSYLDSMELEIAFCNQRIKEVEAYINRIKSTQEWLLNTAKLVINSNGGDPLEGNFGNKISLRKSESVKVDIPAEQLPKKYRKIKVEADKKLIKEDLKNGKKIKGCSIEENQNPGWK